MRLKEFWIRRYGPLPDAGRYSLGDFNLLYGKNEDGKTLTIDALVKFLFKTSRRVFERLDRVDEEPEGYLIIRDGKGEEIKLPEKRDITNIAALSPSEFRNLFIIRNSDLSITLESEFYTNVTDRLTGLRTEEISSIKKKLQELGVLTRPDSGASLSDDVRWGKIKTKVGDARRLVEDIKSLEEEAKRENFDEMEEEVSKVAEAIKKIEQARNDFDAARKRQRYEDGSEALKSLRSAQEEIKKLEVYTEADEQLWRDQEKYVKEYKEQRETLIEEIRGMEEEFKGKEQNCTMKKQNFEVLTSRKKKIDDDIKPEIKDYKMRSGELARQKAQSKFSAIAAIISAVLLSISVFRGSYVLTVLFLILVTVFGWLAFRYITQEAWLRGMFKRIRLNASQFELAGDDIEEILSNIQKFDEEYSKRDDELRGVEQDKNQFEAEIRKLKEKKIPEVEGKIGKAMDEIEKLKRKSGVETLKEYQKQLELRRGYEKSELQQSSILQALFGLKEKTLEENIAYWQAEINSLEEYKEKAREIEYNEKTVLGLKNEKDSLLEQEKDIKRKMRDFNEKLKDTERKANEILQLEADYLHCNTSVDLNAIRSRLEDFISGVEHNKENVVEVIKVFEQIEREEEERVSDLFGKDSPISKYFSQITAGNYQEVEFVSDEKRIQVRSSSGNTLDAEKLSGGTFDQLYLSIRLALGEKLLKGDKGFFIMDDPFIKADPERLRRQFDILKEISELGWQIIYFSAKGEVKDSLRDEIEKDDIQYIELPGTFS